LFFNLQLTLCRSRRLDLEWELDSSSSEGLRHPSLLLYCLSTLFSQGIPFYVFSIWKLYKKYIAEFAAQFPKMINYKKEDLSIPKEFISYRIAEVISECIKFIVQYKRKLSLAERIDQHQMKIWLV